MNMYMFFIANRFKEKVGPPYFLDNEDGYSLYAFTNNKTLKKLFWKYRDHSKFIYRKAKVSLTEYDDFLEKHSERALDISEFTTKFKHTIFRQPQCCTEYESTYVFDEDYVLGPELINETIEPTILISLEKSLKTKYSKPLFEDYGGFGAFIHPISYPDDGYLIGYDDYIIMNQAEIYKMLFGSLYTQYGVEYESLDILLQA